MTDPTFSVQRVAEAGRETRVRVRVGTRKRVVSLSTAAKIEQWLALATEYQRRANDCEEDALREAIELLDRLDAAGEGQP